MSKKHNKLEEVKSALITAAVVVVALQIILWAVKPFLPLIFGLIILVTVGGFLYNKSKHL